MGEESTFPGFPPEGLQFFLNLGKNNNRDWFQAHKQDYIDQIVAPGLSYITALGARLESILPGVRYDLRTNGQGSLGRIYRDVRFSKDKRPYRTRAWFAFWHGPGKKTASPAFSLGFDPEGWKVMAGQHRMSKSILEAYRSAVVDEDLGSELEAALAPLEAGGSYEIGERRYKQVPRGYDPEHPRARWLKFAGVWVSRDIQEPEAVTRPDFVDRSFDECLTLAPLVRWLVRVNDLVRVP